MMVAIMFDINAMREVPPQHRLMGTTGYREKLSDAGERVVLTSDGRLDEDFFDALKSAGLTAASRRAEDGQRMVVYPRNTWLQSFRGVLSATAVDNQGHLEILLSLLIDYADRAQRETGYAIEIPSLTGVVIDRTNRRAEVVPMALKARPHVDAKHGNQGARPAAIIVEQALEGERQTITTATTYRQKIDALAGGAR